jgi:hypothetical protein
MKHDSVDGEAARTRAGRSYTSGWHPILAAVELEPGHWRLLAQYDDVYGEVRLVRRGPEVGYRAQDAQAQLIGYYRSLRSACSAVHMVFVRSHGAPEFQGYPGP